MLQLLHLLFAACGGLFLFCDTALPCHYALEPADSQLKPLQIGEPIIFFSSRGSGGKGKKWEEREWREEGGKGRRKFFWRQALYNPGWPHRFYLNLQVWGLQASATTPSEVQEINTIFNCRKVSQTGNKLFLYWFSIPRVQSVYTENMLFLHYILSKPSLEFYRTRKTKDTHKKAFRNCLNNLLKPRGPSSATMSQLVCTVLRIYFIKQVSVGFACP